MVHLLFDYDGTLHDCLAIYAPAVQEAYDTLVARGYAAPKTWDKEAVRPWIGLSPAKMWERFQPHLPPAEKQARSAQIGQRMLKLAQAGKALARRLPCHRGPGAGRGDGHAKPRACGGMPVWLWRGGGTGSGGLAGSDAGGTALLCRAVHSPEELRRIVAADCA